ncbi:MAG: hypothetical protein BWX90_00933 [bacterium ADurb.Bin132]|nr:MAG: hypothetical protein BWX90_00933 [bacterium ADurb.Bin132]
MSRRSVLSATDARRSWIAGSMLGIVMSGILGRIDIWTDGNVTESLEYSSTAFPSGLGRSVQMILLRLPMVIDMASFASREL